MSDTPRTDSFALLGKGHLFDQEDYDFCAVLERELASEKAKHAWRQIATAPKDGRNILVKTVDGDICEASFYCGVLCREYPTSISATHWMPLPEPPEVKP